MSAAWRQALACVSPVRAWPYPLLAAVAVAAGCAARPPLATTVPQGPHQPELRPLPEEFDPETLADDLLRIEPVAGPPVPAPQAGARQVPPAATTRPPAPVRSTAAVGAPPGGTEPTGQQAGPPPPTSAPQRLVEVFGWRVLLEKVHSYEEAEQVRQQAMDSLTRTDIDVRFREPWYNVEMGHYQAEADAQLALERVRSRFPHALKVRGQIFIPAEE